MLKLVPVLFVAVCICFVFMPGACSINQKPKTANQHHLPNLGIDTLMLKATYSECGEWGGHREMIKIYMSDKAKGVDRDFMKWSGPFTAEFWLDTIGCGYNWDKKYSLIQKNELTHQQEKLIMEYIQSAVYISLKWGPPAHSGNGYSVSSSNPRLLSIRYSARGSDDNIFEPLREQLF